jgi:hypothetical protein
VIGGPLVAVDADDDVSARTQIHAGAPRPTPVPPMAPAPAPLHAETPDGNDVASTLRDPPRRMLNPRPVTPVPVTMHGMPLGLRPPAQSLDIEIAEPTDISMPPEPPISPSGQLRAEPAPSTEPEAAALRSGAMASATADVEAAEVDAELSIEPSIEPSADPSAEPSTEPPPDDPDAPERPSSVEIEALEIQESDAITHELSAQSEPDGALGRPRRTVGAADPARGDAGRPGRAG